MKEKDALAVKRDLQQLKGTDGRYVVSAVTDLDSLIDYIQERTALSKIAAVQSLIDTHHRTATLPSIETLQAFQDGQRQAYARATREKSND